MGKREADSDGADEDSDNLRESLNTCEEEEEEVEMEDDAEADEVEFQIEENASYSRGARKNT